MIRNTVCIVIHGVALLSFIFRKKSFWIFNSPEKIVLSFKLSVQLQITHKFILHNGFFSHLQMQNKFPGIEQAWPTLHCKFYIIVNFSLNGSFVSHKSGNAKTAPTNVGLVSCLCLHLKLKPFTIPDQKAYF